MTGRITVLNWLGAEAIRTPTYRERVRFEAGALVKIPLSEALGMRVDFDIQHGPGGPEAVRIRRHRDAEGAA